MPPKRNVGSGQPERHVSTSDQRTSKRNIPVVGRPAGVDLCRRPFEDVALWLTPAYDTAGKSVNESPLVVSLRRQIRELRHGRKHADRFEGSTLDAINDLQVRDHADLGPIELIAEFDDAWPAAVRGRMSKPGLMRALSVPNDTTGSTPAGTGDRVRVANVLDAILSRDFGCTDRHRSCHGSVPELRTDRSSDHRRRDRRVGEPSRRWVRSHDRDALLQAAMSPVTASTNSDSTASN